MIDFTKYPTLKKSYAGANGSKISVLYHGEIWMVKFPSIAKLNDKIHYANSCVSEYLGCHVFNILGVTCAGEQRKEKILDQAYKKLVES